MRSRAVRISLTALAAFAGLAMLLGAQGLHGSAAREQAKQRTITVNVAKERRQLAALRRETARRSLVLRRVQRNLLPLAQARSSARLAALAAARAPAEASAYVEGYLAAFPIELRDGDEWLIVDSTGSRRVWTANDQDEFQIRDDDVFVYAQGEAPPLELYSVNPDGSQGYYNSDGDWVPGPSSNPNLEPGGPTAICADGTYSYSAHRSGTCSYHGGVSSWYP